MGLFIGVQVFRLDEDDLSFLGEVGRDMAATDTIPKLEQEDINYCDDDGCYYVIAYMFLHVLCCHW